MQQISHYIRFGSHKETKILRHRALKDKAFGLTLNANVVAHTPASLYRMLFTSLPDIDFFIDPQTYIVQLDPLRYYSSEKIINGEKVTQLKNSVQTLLKEYGKPVTGIINHMQSLDASDMKNGIAELTKNVIDFQKHFLFNSYKSKEVDDGYGDYSDSQEYDEKIIEPQYVIPPYFFLSLDEKNWLELNEHAIREALKLERPEKIAAEIVMEKQILFSDSFLNEITDVYNSIDEIGTLFIWMDDFNETIVSSGYIEKFIKFLEKFENKRIINLFGGHFSLLLCKEGILKGFCHGPGYGEHRGVKPVGGGRPTAKYFLPQISQRIDFELATSVLQKKNLLNERYFSEVCDCQVCKQLLSPVPDEINFSEYGKYTMSSTKKSQIPTEDTLSNNQLHYLLKRFSDIKKTNLRDDKKRFREFIEWNSRMRIVSTQHLENWIEVLDEQKKI
jgi:hypothetical protein